MHMLKWQPDTVTPIEPVFVFFASAKLLLRSLKAFNVFKAISLLYLLQSRYQFEVVLAPVLIREHG